jgi:hypothetical protein
LHVDCAALREMAIEPVEVQADAAAWARDATQPIYDDDDLVRALKAIAR